MPRGFEILRVGRRIRGMTQAEVAEHYGVHTKTYQRWELGRTLIAYDDLTAICNQVFRIPLFEIDRVVAYA